MEQNALQYVYVCKRLKECDKLISPSLKDDLVFALIELAGDGYRRMDKFDR